ncbi:MAG TPA: 3-carboxy-cis,cis-muconate cycloisomerase [Solirubrobacteraceae bacterium]|nr:3-carboxy-cis,cis-muconate cycloisomerase [Solirubrobacteraceae bacterium]
MIFSGTYARGVAQEQLSDEAFVRAMLDVEVALARALARHGLAETAAAEELAQACGDAAVFDIDAIGASVAEKGTPVPGLLAAIRARVSAQAGTTLHRGATSQDVVDTAMMLVARRALSPVVADLTGACAVSAELAREHRGSVMAGRTLLQQAAPITFGLKAALWLDALQRARDDLAAVRENALAVQFGGAVGTLAVLGDRGLEVAAELARLLELTSARTPWHTNRWRPAQLASALGCALGSMGKVARDVTLLAQTEVVEATESGQPGRGGSSTMPQKHNPVGAIAVLACAHRAPALVASIFASMVQEHERAAGAWQAEWGPVLELLSLAASAAASLREALELLEVDPVRMRENIDELVMAESVVTALGGGAAAQKWVQQAARASWHERRPLRDLLLEQPDVAERLGAEGLDHALDPAAYLGVAEQLVDRVLDAFAGAGQG